MRAITLMYDSLNRHYLPPYGDTKTIAPNFQRLAEKTVVFDSFYVGSLPCMPARRELHTGRYNFLHRSWGPLEPFDQSVPDLLSKHGICSHCVTDHNHYWQDGGAGYLTRFSSAEMIRGQEGDYWYGQARGFTHNLDQRRQDKVNRQYMKDEKDQPHPKSFAAGMRFLEDNVDADNWYLHLEYFDPHEPFFVSQKYKDLYGGGGKEEFDWPEYGDVREGSPLIDEARMNYRALVSMCDYYLGKVLDFMDEHDMWKDTMLIVNTDHGHMLGEHGFFGKSLMPTYDQMARTPFFIWDPRCGDAGSRRGQLAQTIDIAPTLLEYFGVEKPEHMLGHGMRPILENGESIRQYALFGYFGKHINITDGRYVYMRAGREEGPLFNYTIMPHHLFVPFSVEELRHTEKELVNTFPFTQGVPVMRVPTSGKTVPVNSSYRFEEHMAYGDLLFDTQADPGQRVRLDDAEVENRLTAAMKKIMEENDAPVEQYSRMKL